MSKRSGKTDLAVSALSGGRVAKNAGISDLAATSALTGKYRLASPTGKRIPSVAIDADPPARSRAEALALALRDLESTSPEEDARLTAAALADPDNPPQMVAGAPNKGGRPRSANPKRSVHLRLDREVVEAFEAKGPGWQTRINLALRKAVGLE